MRVVVYVPDLLFGSSVLAQLSSRGHEPVLVSDAEQLGAALPGADALVVDLTADAPQRLEEVRGVAVKTLGFYAHVEADVRALARSAGLDVVIPRSRMAREGALLVEGLVTAGR